jgi:alpha-1,3-rhamnosyl/mannosyltransferase
MPTIGLSANAIDPGLTGGRIDGIGVYTQALLRELPAYGVACQRVLAPAGVRRRPLSAGALRFRIPLAAGISANALFGGTLPGARDVEAGIDLYHATDYLVPRLRRTPVVATLYDAIPLLQPGWGNPRLRALKNRVLAWAAVNADRVIAISRPAVAEVAEAYRIAPDRIRVVPLGIDSRWTDEPPADRVASTLDRYRLRAGYFLFVGTLQPRKNLAMLVSAFERLPPERRYGRQLVIAGRCGWGVDALRESLERRRSEGEVVWLDHVDDDRLRDLYAGAGTFVFPSLAEGFGLPLLEALGAGLPVIASDLEVLREVAGGLACYLPAGDADGWTAALEAAATSTPDPAAVAPRLAWALRFDWTRCAASTVEVYRELL